MKSWRKIGQKEILQHPRLHAIEDEVELPDGSKTSYLRFIDDADYVTVIARRGDRLVLVRDYSYPNDAWLLQFPEGLVEGGETPAEASKRELLEEAGLRAKQITLIGQNLSHHRRSTAKNVIILAEGLAETHQTHLEAEEKGMESLWATEAEIVQKIARGEIIQKNTLAAWATYQAWQTRHSG